MKNAEYNNLKIDAYSNSIEYTYMLLCINYNAELNINIYFV